MMDYLATLEQMNVFALFVTGVGIGTALGMLIPRLMDWMTDRE